MDKANVALQKTTNLYGYLLWKQLDDAKQRPSTRKGPENQQQAITIPHIAEKKATCNPPSRVSDTLQTNTAPRHW